MRQSRSLAGHFSRTGLDLLQGGDNLLLARLALAHCVILLNTRLFCWKWTENLGTGQLELAIRSLTTLANELNVDSASQGNLTSLPPMTPASPDSASWPLLSEALGAFVRLGAEQRLSQLGHLASTVEPWIEHAWSEAATQFAILPSRSAFAARVIVGLGKGKLTFSTQLSFQVWLRSTCLNQVKMELQLGLSRLDWPDAPWHGLRVQINGLPRDQRKDLLACLPACAEAPFLPSCPDLPDAEWLLLWRGISLGVPESSIPCEWRRFFSSRAPAALPALEMMEGGGAPMSRRLILPSRAFESELGRSFHRAAGWAETLAAGSSAPVLPDWVVPKSPALFLKSLEDILKKNGGLPTESSIRQPIEELMNSLNSSKGLGRLGEDPLGLLKVASDLGFGPSIGESLAASHHHRVGDKAASYLALQRALAHASDSKEVASVLANLAGLNLSSGNLSEAEVMLAEALRLSPWSRLAQANLKDLRLLLEGMWGMDSTEEGSS